MLSSMPASSGNCASRRAFRSFHCRVRQSMIPGADSGDGSYILELKTEPSAYPTECRDHPSSRPVRGPAECVQRSLRGIAEKNRLRLL
jgi:hypothetical protein